MRCFYLLLILLVVNGSDATYFDRANARFIDRGADRRGDTRLQLVTEAGQRLEARARQAYREIKVRTCTQEIELIGGA